MQDLQLSGGVGVVVEHAAQLRTHHDIDAQLVLAVPQAQPPWAYRGLDDVPVLSLEEALAREWDIAVASWWETTGPLFRVPAQRHVYFIQLLEDSTFAEGAPQRIAASMTTALPVRFITEARWIAELVEQFQPGNSALYVRNGITKDVFPATADPVPALDDEPLRVVMEGARGYIHKGVDDALHAVSLMREPAIVTWVSPHPVTEPPPGVHRMLSRLSHAEMAALFATQHVILKLSRAEGMYGPPLEAFHCGATVVTTAVTGHDEYVVHGENGLVVGWDDPYGTARALDLLAKDRVLLHRLRTQALETARSWPDWQRSSALMACALRRVASDPPADAASAGARLGSDFASVIGELEFVTWERDVQVTLRHEMTDQTAWRYAIRVRRVVHRVRDRARSVKRWLGRLRSR